MSMSRKYFEDKIRKLYQRIKGSQSAQEMIPLVCRYYELCDIAVCTKVLTSAEVKDIETSVTNKLNANRV